MIESHDEEVRDAFNALWRETQAFVPSFASLTSATAMNAWHRRRRRRRVAALTAAIVVPLFLALRARATHEPDFERFFALTGLDPGEVTWRAPSDFLLDIPGSELLRTVPLIEVTVPSIPADSSDGPPDSNPNKRRRTDS